MLYTVHHPPYTLHLIFIIYVEFLVWKRHAKGHTIYTQYSTLCICKGILSVHGSMIKILYDSWTLNGVSCKLHTFFQLSLFSYKKGRCIFYIVHGTYLFGLKVTLKQAKFHKDFKVEFPTRDVECGMWDVGGTDSSSIVYECIHS